MLAAHCLVGPPASSHSDAPIPQNLFNMTYSNRGRNLSAKVSMPDNNTAERTMRSGAIGRKSYPFVGSQSGGKAAAIAYTLIATAKLNGADPNPKWRNFKISAHCRCC